MTDFTHVKITNTPLIRELSSHAVLNTDLNELEKYKRTRATKLKEEAHKKQLETRINNLETKLEEILRKLNETQSNTNS